MATNKKDLLTQMTALQKKVDSGKIKGKKSVFKARKKIASLKFRAKKVSNSGIPLITIKAKRKTKVAKKAPKHQFVQEQGFIPGFLKMMNMVKIEEMVAQKLFNEIKAQLEGLTAREVELAKVAEDINERMGAMQISFAGVRKAKKQA